MHQCFEAVLLVHRLLVAIHSSTSYSMVYSIPPLIYPVYTMRGYYVYHTMCMVCYHVSVGVHVLLLVCVTANRCSEDAIDAMMCRVTTCARAYYGTDDGIHTTSSTTTTSSTSCTVYSSMCMYVCRYMS